MESFYRHMRSKIGVLMNGDEPEGGQWNLDHDNREPFPKAGPGDPPAPHRFTPDDVTDAVCAMVEERYADHPGTTAHFDLPVTRPQALAMLRDFVAHRLRSSGRTRTRCGRATTCFTTAARPPR